MKKNLFLITAVAQVVLLLFIAASYYAVDIFGKEIQLKTAPIDPYDVFYGEYVVLNYDISRISSSLAESHNETKNAKFVYVTLSKKKEVYVAKKITKYKPKASATDVVLKAQVNYVGEDWESDDEEKIDYYHLTYGIERYYVEQGLGLDIENHPGKTDVIVKIAPWGQLKTKSLIQY